MRITATELAYVRLIGLYVTQKCDGCGKLLNQTIHYTIAGRPQVYCSALCRDTAFFGNRHEAEKLARPGKCTYCGGSLSGKKRGALYCDDACRKAHARKTQAPHNAVTRKIADTNLVQSIAYKDANRRLGQSLCPDRLDRCVWHRALRQGERCMTRSWDPCSRMERPARESKWHASVSVGTAFGAPARSRVARSFS